MIKNKKKNLLVVAAHPDDEVLGCGGTILKYSKKGYNINLIFFTDGVGSRINKNLNKKKIVRINAAIKAAKILGCKKPNFNEFPDNELDKISNLKLVKIIENEIKKTKPEIIFTHFKNDLNIDHKKINQALVTACRPQKNRTVKKILFFEVPSSTEWQIDKSKNIFNPNWFEDITNEFKKKINAIKCYKDELRKSPHPRSIDGITSLNKWRGSTIGVKYAEAFMLGRFIS